MKRLLTIATMAVLVTLAASVARAEGTAMANGEVLALYERIHASLAADSAEGVAEAAAQIAEKVQPCDCSGGEKSAYEGLGEAARAMTGDDLEQLRAGFRELSTAMAAWVDAVGAETTQLYYCPMAQGYWLQSKSEEGTRNPYYGQSMLKCGTKVDKVES